MAQDFDIVERLEKQIEGSNLALAAVAEVLHKMDSRISKQEDFDMELAENEEDAFEKQEIIKAVAGEVYGLIKADQGMPDMDKEGSAKERKASSVTKGHDDSEKAVTVVNKLTDQQATLQAMQKQLNLLKAGWNDESADMEENNGDEEEEEEDTEEELEEGYGYGMENAEQYPVIENMQKQINELKSALNGATSMQKAVQVETEGRLRKMGFREETSLTRPTVIRYEDTIGTDGTTPIQKESGGDTVDQMMQMSYQDLRRLQETIESGETDGLPRELIG
jgi:hypothetical protein